jgi:hypothetical protein
VRATAACKGVEGGHDMVWVEPRVTVEVRYNELMRGRLRDLLLRSLTRS